MSHKRFLKTSVSSAALIAVSSVGLISARAQDNAAPIETVTVTGTSFHIAEPVGSNVVAVTAVDLQQAGGTGITEMLSETPALTGMNVPDRDTGSSNGRPGSAIFIHGIGSNGDGTTLVLVDGHRAPLSGGINNFVNPNNIPPVMIERVEILTEGASAVYGSDAIAGVVNFITRSNFDGLQINYSSGLVKGQFSNDIGVVFGSTWEKGGFVFGGEYQTQPNLFNTALPYTNPLAQPARALAAGLPVASQPSAVTNFGNFNCNPATIQPNGAGNIYQSAQSATNFANAAANSLCQQWSDATAFASNRRIGAMIKVHENMGSLHFAADLDYMHRESTGQISAGVLTATAFGTGAQANPFYTLPPGVSATNTKETVRYDLNGLFKPQASIAGDQFINGSLDLTWDAGNDWTVEGLAAIGLDDSLFENYGGVNIGLATLALNGTTQSGGSTTATSLPGYNATTINLPLTTANALDVWNPVGTNRTSATTLASLTNDKNMASYFYATTQMRLTAQGPLFSLPAGKLQVAFGAEIYNQSTWQNLVTPEGNAGSNQASAYTNLNLHRGDKAAFVEFDVPAVSPDMNIPLIQKLDFDLAVRRDEYTDFPATTNPKVSMTWMINDSYSFRANYSTGFEAPQLSLTGTGNGQAGFSTASSTTLAIALPVALYPLVTQEGIPGCTAASVTCPINTLQGAVAHTGEFPATAMTGRSWNLGADIHPDWLPGFTANLTYWHTSEEKGTNSPSQNLSVNTPALVGRIILTPGCATQAQLNSFLLANILPLTSPFPNCTQFMQNQDAQGYVTFKVEGLDATLGYKYDTDYGQFAIDDNLSQTLSWKEGFCRNCTATVLFSVLNTDGVNAIDPSIGIQNRMHLGWGLEGLVTDFFVDWTSGFRDVASPVIPITVGPLGQLTGGGDHVNAYVQFDAHVGYTFNTEWTGSDVIGLTIKNLTNETPPYWNSSQGYDATTANPLGRTYTLNLTAKF
jgi:iron complex outermembrane receptor protein